MNVRYRAEERAKTTHSQNARAEPNVMPENSCHLRRVAEIKRACGWLVASAIFSDGPKLDPGKAADRRVRRPNIISPCAPSTLALALRRAVRHQPQPTPALANSRSQPALSHMRVPCACMCGVTVRARVRVVCVYVYVWCALVRACVRACVYACRVAWRRICAQAVSAPACVSTPKMSVTDHGDDDERLMERGRAGDAQRALELLQQHTNAKGRAHVVGGSQCAVLWFVMRGCVCVMHDAEMAAARVHASDAARVRGVYLAASSCAVRPP
jgi:hypothetical protein